jgi:hypothetical protein
LQPLMIRKGWPRDTLVLVLRLLSPQLGSRAGYLSDLT